MALEDIIPLDALLGKQPQYGNENGEKGKKKKKDRPRGDGLADDAYTQNGCAGSPRP